MSEWLKVIILGIVEGITEFLPISSTGHLIVTTALLDFQNNLDGTFEIFIQLGAIVAVILFYRRELWQQTLALPRDRRTQRFWFYILVASVPAALIGIPLRHEIKTLLFHPEVVAAALIIGGIIFLLIERRPIPKSATNDALDLTFRQALIIGIAQTTALIPGVSRSGASIIGGMQAGLNRPAATQFSFYLAIPTLGGATLLELVSVLDEISGIQIAFLILGAVVSGIVAWVAIGWLLRYVATNTFVVFGYYRIVAGIVIVLALSMGLI
jgi:undecaprenyl-diphosphatase